MGSCASVGQSGPTTKRKKHTTLDSFSFLFLACQLMKAYSVITKQGVIRCKEKEKKKSFSTNSPGNVELIMMWREFYFEVTFILL